MAEASSYPVAVPTRTENTLGVATLRTTQTNNATYSHALIHQQVGADVVALATYLGTNASQTAPVANTILYSASNGVSIWSASPTLTTLTLSTDLIVDTNTFIVDGSDSRVYVGATSSSATEIFQVFGSTRLQSAAPSLRFNETDAAADNKEWQFTVAGEQFFIGVINDAGAGSSVLSVDRTGLIVNDIVFSNYAATRLTIGQTYVGPSNDNAISSGKSGNRYTEVWAVNGTIQTSDLDQKNILDFKIDTEQFVDAISPIAYTWKDTKKWITNEEGDLELTQKEESEKRTHIGYGAQHVLAEIERQGLSAQDFAGYIESDDGKGIRYEEVQVLQTDGLKKKINKLESALEAALLRIEALEA